jgi:hypothetical protein
LHGKLAAENRRSERITRNDDREIGAGMQIRIEIDAQSWIEPADLDLARRSHI